MKLWGGRFSGEAEKLLERFNNSLSFDSRLWKEDIKGSIAHAKMLTSCGILTPNEGEKLVLALEEIATELNEGLLEFDYTLEDIHTQIEVWLIEKLGDIGKKLHTARSRNDQVATDLRLYLKGSLKNLAHLVEDLLATLALLAKEHSTTVLPGYTHLQRAQPIVYGHQLLAYAEMLFRDLDRLQETYKRTDVLPLGAGALAGVTYPLEQAYTQQLLGFGALCQNSLDAVSDRDFVLDYLYTCSVIMLHLSRLAEELVIYSSLEFGFIELADGYSTGSSIMPQKKNPDVPELIRGKTGRVCGDLQAMLMTLKGLPLSYNKDLQEDKEAVFDAGDNTTICLEIITPLLKTMKVNKEMMLKAAQAGFLNATDLADALVQKGVPFREAHRIVGEIVRLGLEYKQEITEIPLVKLQAISPLIDKAMLESLDLVSCVNRRITIGGTAVTEVRKKADEINLRLNEAMKFWQKEGSL